jgi:hypothetical protein
MAIPRNIPEQIENIKDLEISYRMLHNSAIINDTSSDRTIEIPFESLINKYKHILSDIIINVTLDDRLSRHYLYNPKLLSYDLYNTVELWSELLRLNNWSSVTEFKPVKIKIYNPRKLKAFLNEILILEEKI